MLANDTCLRRCPDELDCDLSVVGTLENLSHASVTNEPRRQIQEVGK